MTSLSRCLFNVHVLGGTGGMVECPPADPIMPSWCQPKPGSGLLARGNSKSFLAIVTWYLPACEPASLGTLRAVRLGAWSPPPDGGGGRRQTNSQSDPIIVARCLVVWAIMSLALGGPRSRGKKRGVSRHLTTGIAHRHVVVAPLRAPASMPDRTTLLLPSPPPPSSKPGGQEGTKS